MAITSKIWIFCQNIDPGLHELLVDYEPFKEVITSVFTLILLDVKLESFHFRNFVKDCINLFTSLIGILYYELK